MSNNLPLFPDITRITPENLQEYPTVSFEGDIVLVDTIEAADLACDFLQNCSILGFDTETKPNFKKGKRNNVALLQLAANERVYLFRTNKIGFPRRVASILADPGIMKVGAAIKDDISTLRHLTQFEPKNFLDLQTLVHSYGVEQLGLKNIAALFLGYKISKTQQLSNWENPFLTTQQQIYAATDAWICLKIYNAIAEAGYFQNPPKVIVSPKNEIENSSE